MRWISVTKLPRIDHISQFWEYVHKISKKCWDLCLPTNIVSDEYRDISCTLESKYISLYIYCLYFSQIFATFYFFDNSFIIVRVVRLFEIEVSLKSPLYAHCKSSSYSWIIVNLCNHAHYKYAFYMSYLDQTWFPFGRKTSKWPYHHNIGQVYRNILNMYNVYI